MNTLLILAPESRESTIQSGQYTIWSLTRATVYSSQWMTGLRAGTGRVETI